MTALLRTIETSSVADSFGSAALAPVSEDPSVFGRVPGGAAECSAGVLRSESAASMSSTASTVLSSQEEAELGPGPAPGLITAGSSSAGGLSNSKSHGDTAAIDEGPDTRGMALGFLRELFGISKTLAPEKRY